MKLHRLRARLLIALGLPAACAPAEPAQTPAPENPSQSAPEVEPPAEPEPEPAAELRDAGASDAPSTSPDATAVATPPDSATVPAEPASAWRVSYKLAPGTEKWCTHGSVRCQPAADTTGAPQGGTKLGCPSAIEVQCPCTPAGCNQLGPCIAPLHAQVSLRERAREKSACCYDLPRQCVPPYVGRPLRSDGELWRAKQWEAIAGFEHASVASFARVALELLALGAPQELVRATFEAALDEIEHARLAYSVASRSAGTAIGPMPLPAGALGVPDVDLEAFAVATFEEGCVEETLGALVASELAEAENDPGIRDVLAQIAEDETRHAELAWRTLAWALGQAVEPVTAAVRSKLDALAAAACADPRRAELLREVVVPCLDALVTSATRRSDPSRMHS